MKYILVMTTAIMLSGCGVDAERGIKEYNKTKEMCPKEYTVKANKYSSGSMVEKSYQRYYCELCPSKEELNACIDSTTGYFKNLSGEFEDWDTSDLKDIIKECKTCDMLRF